MYTFTDGKAGSAIDFGQAASPEPAAAELVERKACEGLCGGFFWRPRPAMAWEGEKVCAACRAQIAEQALTVSQGYAILIGDPRSRSRPPKESGSRAPAVDYELEGRRARRTRLQRAVEYALERLGAGGEA